MKILAGFETKICLTFCQQLTERLKSWHNFAKISYEWVDSEMYKCHISSNNNLNKKLKNKEFDKLHAEWFKIYTFSIDPF